MRRAAARLRARPARASASYAASPPQLGELRCAPRAALAVRLGGRVSRPGLAQSLVDPCANTPSNCLQFQLLATRSALRLRGWQGAPSDTPMRCLPRVAWHRPPVVWPGLLGAGLLAGAPGWGSSGDLACPGHGLLRLRQEDGKTAHLATLGILAVCRVRSAVFPSSCLRTRSKPCPGQARSPELPHPRRLTGAPAPPRMACS